MNLSFNNSGNNTRNQDQAPPMVQGYSSTGAARYGAAMSQMSQTSRQSDHGTRQRDALVMAHAAMVRRVALHMADRLEGNTDPDDLIQSGMLGLLEAAQRYTPVEGIPFEAYALPRIRGAMVDSLRRNDWCPRSIRKDGRELKAVHNQLLQQLGRNPTDSELAEASGQTIEACRRVQQTLQEASVQSLDAVLEKGESLLPLTQDNASAPVIRQRMQKVLVEALKHLPEREQRIMQLYYSEELNQKEIAQVLEITGPCK